MRRLWTANVNCWFECLISNNHNNNNITSNTYTDTSAKIKHFGLAYKVYFFLFPAISCSAGCFLLIHRQDCFAGSRPDQEFISFVYFLSYFNDFSCYIFFNLFSHTYLFLLGFTYLTVNKYMLCSLSCNSKLQVANVVYIWRDVHGASENFVVICLNCAAL